MNELNNKHGSYRTIAFFACSLAFIVSLFACNSDRVGRFEHPGMLQMSVTADTSGINYNEPTTKADISSDLKPLLNTDLYKVEILQGAENTVIQTFDHYKDMPDLVELERGDYKIRASMGELKPATFDSPCTEGTSDFIIKEDMTTKLNITCALINARVTVAYTDSFKMVYPTHKTEIETSHTTTPLEFSQRETRAGWFQVNAEGEELTCILSARQDTGAVKQFSVKIPAVKPKDDVRLTFNSSQENRPDRGLTVKITINQETIEKPVYIYVPDYMLPVKAVALDSEGFAHEDAISLSNGGEDKDVAKVRIFAPGTIKYCWLTKVLDGQPVDKYDLATTQGAAKAIAGNEGLVLPEILKKKDITIDFTTMINKLPRNEESDKKVHTYDYILQVQDSLIKPHLSEPLTLRIKMIPNVAPQIHVGGFTSGLLEKIVEGGVSDDDNTAKTYTAKVISSEDISSCSLEVTNGNGQKTTHEASTLNELANKTGVPYNEDSKTFDFTNAASTLETPSATVSNASYVLNVSTLYDGTTYTASSKLNLSVAPPKFEMTMNGNAEWNGDAFAKRALLRAKATKGSKHKISGFEYKDGSSWELIEKPVTIDSDDEAVLVFEGLTPQKIYSVRSVYGKHKSAEITFTTEAIMQLPNVSAKGIESWFSEPYGSGGRTIWYPWNKDDESTKGWETSNKESMESGNGNNYESAASVMQNGNATLIRTIGKADKGAIGWTTTFNIAKQTVGTLYLGNNTEKGIEFGSRPLKLSFDYIYTLKSNQESSFSTEIIVKTKDGDILSKEYVTRNVGAGLCEILLNYKKGSKVSEILEITIKSDIGSGTLRDEDAKGSGFIPKPPSTEMVGSQLTITNLQLNYE